MQKNSENETNNKKSFLLSQNAKNGLDKVKIKREKILVYIEVHEFSLFAILALDKPLSAF